MANVLSLKHLKNKVSRNGFDMSERRTFTAKVGELLPCFVLETIPGDTVNINPSHFTRTMPINTAAFCEIKEYVHYYFVPYRLLHSDCPQFFSDNKENSFKASDINGGKKLSDNLPYISHKDLVFYLKHLLTVGRRNPVGFKAFNLTCKLLEYLGYGSFLESTVDYMYDFYQKEENLKYNYRLNPFALLAYQKIYQDHFRNQQWERTNPSACNIDYMKFDTALPLSSLHKDVSVAQNDMFTLRYIDFAKDYFFGVLPNAQYGDVATFPVNGSQELIKALTANRPVSSPYPSGSGVLAPDPETMNGGSSRVDKQTWNPNDSIGTRSAGGKDTDDNNLFKPVVITDSEGGTGGFSGGYLPDFNNPLNPPSPDSGYTPNSENPFQNISLSASVLALRKAEALQKYREIKQTGKQDYKDYLSKIFNVTIPDSASDLSIYLGGYNSSVSINEVVNTALSDDNSVADIKGKGISSGGSNTISFEAKDFGVIIGVYSARPVLEYALDTPIRTNIRVTLDDYANPVFDKIGMETVRLNEFVEPSLLHRESFDGGEFDSSQEEILPFRPVGYVPRYASYKTNYDKVLGEFRNTLKAWVAPRTSLDILWNMFSTSSSDRLVRNYLTYTTFKVDPGCLNSIFTQKANDKTSTDQLLVRIQNNCPIVRNLDYDGLPY